MRNSLSRRARAYAPRAAVKRKRIGVGLDPTQLAECQAWAKAEDKSDAAYVLSVYLEGQAARRAKLAAAASQAP